MYAIAPRQFFIEKCGYNVSIPDVYKAFAAHQVEWNLMGRDAPWWSVLTDPAFQNKQDISSDRKRGFYDSGVQHVQMLNVNFENMRILDFGCGLGRLAFSFAAAAPNTRVTCLDQSVHHLKIAQREWRARGTAHNIDFVVSGPDLLSSLYPVRFDFVHSVLVLQHMVPALQTIYMEQFCDLLVPGGQGWLQIPHKTPSDGCDLDRSIREGGMQMHFTTPRQIKEVFRRRGCIASLKNVGDMYVGGSCRSTIVRFSKSTT